MRTHCMSLLALCFLVPCVAAQDQASQESGRSPRPGDRVRVTAGRPASTMTGVLVSLDAAALVLESPPSRERPAERYRIDLTTLHRLEVIRGSKAHTLTGVWIGGGIGLLAGVVAVSVGRSEGGEEGLSSGQANALFGVLFAALGAGTGALIGSQVKTDRWETVPFPPHEDPLVSRGSLEEAPRP